MKKNCIVFIFFLLHSLYANEEQRLQAISTLKSVSTSTAFHIKTATVAWKDIERLRKDFPELLKLSEEEIDKWILDNFAFITEHQLKLGEIRNTTIQIEPKKSKIIYHPNLYHRGSIIEAKTPKRTNTNFPDEELLDKANTGSSQNISKKTILLDCKGSGWAPISSDPYMSKKYEELFTDSKYIRNNEELVKLHNRHHSDGLMSLGEAIAEVTRQKLAQKIFSQENSGETVESYFIIDTGFNILRNVDEQVPAAIYGRQAHKRATLPIPQKALKALAALNQVGAHSPFMEFTQSGALVDFGDLVIYPNKKHLKQYGIRYHYANMPESSSDIAPFLIDFNKFGGPIDAQGASSPQKANPWTWGHKTAKAYRKGDKIAIKRHIREMLQDAIKFNPAYACSKIFIQK